MEYAKDEVFNVKYNNENMIIREEETSSIISTIKQNKIIQLIMGITFILCVANFVFIYNFFSILSKI